MNFEATIRRANTVDAQAIVTVFVEARKQALPYLPELHTNAEILNWIEIVILAKETVWVAEIDGRIQGFISFTNEELNHLYIAPMFQGKGIGQSLLKVAKNRSRNLRLYTFQKNESARRFYEGQGFKVIGITDGSRNEEKEPDVLMEWTSSEVMIKHSKKLD